MEQNGDHHAKYKNQTQKKPDTACFLSYEEARFKKKKKDMNVGGRLFGKKGTSGRGEE
jgi:hypothetical protein